MTVSEGIGIAFLIVLFFLGVLAFFGYRNLMKYKENQVEELNNKVDYLYERLINIEDKNGAEGSNDNNPNNPMYDAHGNAPTAVKVNEADE